MNTQEEKHIGEMIKKKLAEKDLTVEWLARRILVDSSNLRKTLKNKSMRTDLLKRISDALDYRFFDDI